MKVFWGKTFLNGRQGNNFLFENIQPQLFKTKGSGKTKGFALRCAPYLLYIIRGKWALKAGSHWTDFDRKKRNKTKRCESQRKQPPAPCSCQCRGTQAFALRFAMPGFRLHPFSFVSFRFFLSKSVQCEPAFSLKTLVVSLHEPFFSNSRPFHNFQKKVFSSPGLPALARVSFPVPTSSSSYSTHRVVREYENRGIFLGWVGF